MNKLFVLSLIAILTLTSCCDSIECNEKQIGGLIPLDSSNVKVTDFHRTDKISFVNSNGARFEFRYRPIQFSQRSDFVDCISSGCDDFCCNHVESEIRSFSLDGIDLPISINITLSKHGVSQTTPVTTMGDMLFIKHTNAYLYIPMADGVMNIDSISVQKDDSLNLFGHKFYDVYSNKVVNHGDSLSAYVKTIYFNRAKGVVGWSLYNGEIWSLE